MKQCKECNEIKELDEYYMIKDYPSPYCKTCDKARRKRDYHANIERSRYQGIKSRAKRQGLEMTLTLDEYKELLNEAGTHCPVLGIEFGDNKTNRPEIDKFDPNKGYTKDNCKIICGRANAIKYNASVEEIEAILKYMKGKPNG